MWLGKERVNEPILEENLISYPETWTNMVNPVYIWLNPCLIMSSYYFYEWDQE